MDGQQLAGGPQRSQAGGHMTGMRSPPTLTRPVMQP